VMLVSDRPGVYRCTVIVHSQRPLILVFAAKISRPWMVSLDFHDPRGLNIFLMGQVQRFSAENAHPVLIWDSVGGMLQVVRMAEGYSMWCWVFMNSITDWDHRQFWDASQGLSHLLMIVQKTSVPLFIFGLSILVVPTSRLLMVLSNFCYITPTALSQRFQLALVVR
jgi:hypothetical protein